MPTYYDVALGTTHQYFSSRVMEFCAQFDLSFFLAEPAWVEELLRKVRAGEIRVRVYLDMASDAYQPGNLYYALAREVKNTGGHVIDDPDRAAVAAHKGIFHRMLVENNVPVPETVIVQRSGLEGFRLTDEIRSLVGVPFVVKPGWGGGRWGVILNAESEEDVHRSAGEADYSDSFLIQRKVVPRKLDGRVGWFRTFYVFGEVILCWWEPQSGYYQLVTPLEERRFRLSRVEKIARDIARISKIRFFSTEVALCEDGRFLAIDYLNTGCDMHAKSFWPSGVPDEVVRHIAWVLVDHARAIARRRRGPFDEELAQKDEDWEERRKKGLVLPGEGAM